LLPARKQNIIVAVVASLAAFPTPEENTHRVGSGTGPDTVAPVEAAAPMMASPASTMARVSNDLSLMRMDCVGDPAAAATAEGAAARVETAGLATAADRCAMATTGAILK